MEDPRDRAYERADIHPLGCVLPGPPPPRPAGRGKSSASAGHPTAATLSLEFSFPVKLFAFNPCSSVFIRGGHFAAVVVGRGGAFFTYLSIQLIISAIVCSTDSRPA